jgi:hypothetical protein
MAMSKGCTVALIIVAAILLLIIAFFIILYFSRHKIMNSMIDDLKTKIVANLPEGYTEAQVDTLMNDLKVGIKNGEINRQELQELAGSYQTAISDRKISKEEGANLLMLIEKALGKKPPTPEEAPADTLPDTTVAVPDSA